MHIAHGIFHFFRIIISLHGVLCSLVRGRLHVEVNSSSSWLLCAFCFIIWLHQENDGVAIKLETIIVLIHCVFCRRESLSRMCISRTGSVVINLKNTPPDTATYFRSQWRRRRPNPLYYFRRQVEQFTSCGLRRRWNKIKYNVTSLRYYILTLRIYCCIVNRMAVLDTWPAAHSHQSMNHVVRTAIALHSQRNRKYNGKFIK